MKLLKQRARYAVFAAICAMALGACSDSDDDDSPDDDHDHENGETSGIGLPGDLFLSVVNATDGGYYLFNTETEERLDLNEEAAASSDTGVQNLMIDDVSMLGHFVHWPDFRVIDDEEHFDMKYVLMKPSYVPGSVIDSDQFIQLAHFHDDMLAAHAASEFANPEPGSNKAAGLERLNQHVAEQAELVEEIEEVMPEGEQLCRAYIDPYLLFEEGHEHDEEETATREDDEHEHGELVHFALSDTGRMYFFHEEEAGLEQSQGFVKLDEVSTIADCTRTTIARTGPEGVLVFIPDTQRLYLVDAHGGDFHQHSTWSIAEILPEGAEAHMVAVIGAGEGDDHDHEDE